MEDVHGEDIASGETGEPARGQTFERTGGEPMIAAPHRPIAPPAYSRTINIAWWLAAFVTGAVIWVAVLD